MASTTNDVIAQVKIDTGAAKAIAASAYGECSTAAATAAKTVEMTGFTLITGVTIHVKFTNSNTIASPTLNVNNTGAKPIIRYGTTAPSTSSKTSWNAGSIVGLTYDGTSWVMNDWLNDDSNTTYAYLVNTVIGDATACPIKIDAAGYGARYSLIFPTEPANTSTPELYSSLVKSRSSGTTKVAVTPTSGKFYADRTPLYIYSADVAANAMPINNIYQTYTGLDLRYTANVSNTYLTRTNKCFLWLKNFNPIDKSFEADATIGNVVSLDKLETRFPTTITDDIYLYFLGWTTATWYTLSPDFMQNDKIYKYVPSTKELTILGDTNKLDKAVGGRVTGELYSDSLTVDSLSVNGPSNFFDELTSTTNITSNSNIYSCHSDVLKGTAPAATSWRNLIFKDNSGNTMGQINSIYYTSKDYKLRIGAMDCTSASGAEKSYLSLGVTETTLSSTTGKLNLVTNSPLEIKNTSGAYQAVYGAAYTNKSSERYKENIKDLSNEDGLKLLELRPVTFDYTDKINGTNCIGLIAEEVAKVESWPVVCDEENRPDAIDYSRFTPQLIKLCQIQQKQIDELTKRIEILENK